MKVFANDKVYIQNDDLVFLMRASVGVSIPASIIEKVFGGIFVVNEQNRYDFVEFDLEEEIEFFKNCDWILDYNSFDGMSEEEIVDAGMLLINERKELVVKYNKLVQDGKIHYPDELGSKIELLDHKIESVRNILWHKNSTLYFPLPEGTKEDYIKFEDQIIPKKEEKENVLKRVLKKFKK